MTGYQKQKNKDNKKGNPLFFLTWPLITCILYTYLFIYFIFSICYRNYDEDAK